MGLTSLACLNRSGVYSYWEDNWDSTAMYRRYYYGNFFLKILIIDLLSGSFFNSVFLKTKNSASGYHSKFKITSTYAHRNIVFGKIWYLRYQDWLVIVIYYYDLKMFTKKKIFKKKLISSTIRKYNKYRYFNKFNCIQNSNFTF